MNMPDAMRPPHLAARLAFGLALLFLAAAGMSGAIALELPTTRLDAQTAPQDLSNRAGSIAAPEGDLDVEAVRQLAHQGQLQPHDVGERGLGYTQDTLWLYFRLANATAAPMQRLLIVRYPLLDHVVLYRFDGGVQSWRRESGDRVPYDQRDLPLRNPNFRLQLEPGQASEFVMEIRTDSAMIAPLLLTHLEQILPEVLLARLGFGLYYGIFLALGVYHLFLYVSVRDRSFLWYAAYAFSYGMLLFFMNGFAFGYLLPNHPAMANMAIPLLIAMAQATILQFSRHFLGLSQRSPGQDRLIAFFAVISLPIGLAAGVIGYGPTVHGQSLMALAMAVLVASVAICNLRKNPPARFFLLAWTAMLIGTAAYSAMTLGWLGKTPLTEYGIQIGSALEMLLLAFGMAHRIKLLTRDKERIEREAREHLEQRVGERTSELDGALKALAHANARLQDFSRRDGLTGLFNRRHLDDALHNACTSPYRSSTPMALMMIDVDHFKSINDEYGHVAGDDCLRHLARRMEHLAGEISDATVARYGGEEFAILLPGIAAEDAVLLAERIRDDIAQDAPPIDRGEIRLTVSIGLYLLPPGMPCHATQLLKQADSGLYLAKRSGRNRLHVTSIT